MMLALFGSCEQVASISSAVLPRDCAESEVTESLLTTSCDSGHEAAAENATDPG
jgi:hypothetical protein